MRYPIKNPSDIPGSGNSFYLFLLDNISIPARSGHEIWYQGMNASLNDPKSPFRGFFPIGQTLEIAYGSNHIEEYTFTGEEKNPVFVKDLGDSALETLNIPKDCKPNAKVFNPYFRLYDDLPIQYKKDNELPTLTLAKSISDHLGSQDSCFTETDVMNMLKAACRNWNSSEMRHILFGNHIGWAANRFLSLGIMDEDIKKNYFQQNEIEFYINDIGTIMPGILYALAMLGVDPIEEVTIFKYDLYGIHKAANAFKEMMKKTEAMA